MFSVRKFKCRRSDLHKRVLGKHNYGCICSWMETVVNRINFVHFNSECFVTSMSAADTIVERSELDHVAAVKQLQATDAKFSVKRLSLRRSPSLPRKGSLEAAGFDTSFFVHQTPLLEGHVFKDGRGTMAHRGFTKRYFLLFEGVLIYYSHQSSYQRDQKNCLVSTSVQHALYSCRVCAWY